MSSVTECQMDAQRADCDQTTFEAKAQVLKFSSLRLDCPIHINYRLPYPEGWYRLGSANHLAGISSIGSSVEQATPLGPPPLPPLMTATRRPLSLESYPESWVSTPIALMLSGVWTTTTVGKGREYLATVDALTKVATQYIQYFVLLAIGSAPPEAELSTAERWTFRAVYPGEGALPDSQCSDDRCGVLAASVQITACFFPAFACPTSHSQSLGGTGDPIVASSPDQKQLYVRQQI
ncbi:hypothetical protein PM082_005054 [Marasmius tenuissimus]|nr:hypothetical protein PM082_005054 [Marasmius tenuissimus]